MSEIWSDDNIDQRFTSRKNGNSDIGTNIIIIVIVVIKVISDNDNNNNDISTNVSV